MFTAKERMAEMLRESGDLVGDAKQITHPVKFFEGRQAAGDRHHAAVVHPQRRPR